MLYNTHKTIKMNYESIEFKFGYLLGRIALTVESFAQTGEFEEFLEYVESCIRYEFLDNKETDLNVDMLEMIMKKFHPFTERLDDGIINVIDYGRVQWNSEKRQIFLIGCGAWDGEEEDEDEEDEKDEKDEEDEEDEEDKIRRHCFILNLYEN
jgi:TATA-binding protein-associated factor Taf7